MAEVYEDVVDEALDDTQTDDSVNESPENEVAENAAQETQGESPSLAEMEKEHSKKTVALGAECDRLEYEFNVKNAEQKEAKKRLEAKVDELRRHIRSGPDPQRELPFGDDGEVDGSGESSLFDNAWESAPITDALTLTTKQQEKLEEAGVKTVGEFERLRAGTPDYPDGLRSLHRVGDSTVDKWEEEILDWLAQNQPVEEGSEPEAEPDFDSMGRMVAGATDG